MDIHYYKKIRPRMQIYRYAENKVLPILSKHG